MVILASDMYTKQEAAKQRQAFWTTFGQYMQPILSADGEKTNWINYKTGVPHIHFRMDTDNRQASIAIVLSHPDTGIQQLYYEQLLQLKAMLRDATGEDWQWQPMITDEHGKIISRIGTYIDGLNINRTEDWPGLISFFKPRIIALDAFWSMARYGLEGLL